MTSLMTDLFLSPEAAIVWLAEAHEKLRGPFKDADFERLRQEIPDEPRNTRLGVRTPVWYDDTVGDTFERQIALITYQYGEDGVWRWPDLKSDPKHLRLLGGDKYHPGQCLRWETLDLDPVPKRRQKTYVRQPGRSPHAGVFATVAVHPQYGRGMNGDDKPFLWAPGYKCKIPGPEVWRLVPGVDFDYDSRRVELDACWYDSAGSSRSSPAYLGS